MESMTRGAFLRTATPALAAAATLGCARIDGVRPEADDVPIPIPPRHEDVTDEHVDEDTFPEGFVSQVLRQPDGRYLCLVRTPRQITGYRYSARVNVSHELLTAVPVPPAPPAWVDLLMSALGWEVAKDLWADDVPGARSALMHEVDKTFHLIPHNGARGVEPA